MDDSNFISLNSTGIVRFCQDLGGAIVTSERGLQSFNRFMRTAEGFDRIICALAGEINVIPFPSCAVTLRFRRGLVSRGQIDGLFVCWLYSRRGPIAIALKWAKMPGGRDNEVAQSALASFAWSVLPGGLVDRLLATDLDIIVTSVPSRTSVADRLAVELARKLVSANVPVSVNLQLLRRIQSIETKEMPWSERREQTKKMFAAGSDSISSKCVLLVDDVVTSGATMEACGSLLKSIGAAEVICVSMTAAPEDDPNLQAVRAHDVSARL
ncbi:phosphoribosyltransferase family protein [Bradyrhizobium sp. ORS 375]|uniref:ComF family protein n=1 Tax=Bradyrhizobium sp. (strain ORS 375) TaxID=566679 RepID=UPI0015852141|nr:phosphoribosyltransferase family protein [Bradyrhizobium sp. ORS 375]